MSQMKVKEARNKKVRLSVPFSEELYKAVEDESKLMGVSMSSMVAFIVASYITSKNTLMDGFKGVIESKLKSALENKKE